MTAAGFRRLALGFTDAIEGAHMGHPDFRVNGRIFATLHADSAHGMVKLTPEQQQRFISEDPRAFAPESGAWGRAGCTRVTLKAVDEDTLGEADAGLAEHGGPATGAAAEPRRSTEARPEKTLTGLEVP